MRGIVATMAMCSAAFVAGTQAQPAAASCAPPMSTAQAIANADVVVVGTVSSTRSRDRVATVSVEEVWKGSVGNSFEVFGGPDRDDAATSVDRTYRVGVRYLLLAFEPAAHGSPGTFGGRYEDTACSATQPWDDSLARFRPSTAAIVAASTTSPPRSSSPVTDSASRRNGVWKIVVGAAIAGAALTGTVLWRRARRARTS